jgi:hypothetical protein
VLSRFQAQESPLHRANAATASPLWLAMCKPADLCPESYRADRSRESAAAVGERFVDVVVIGAGLQGVTVAAFMRREGIDDFLIVDEVRARSCAEHAGICASASRGRKPAGPPSAHWAHCHNGTSNPP